MTPPPEATSRGALQRLLAVYLQGQFPRYLLFSGIAALTNFIVGLLLYDGAGWDGPVSYRVAVSLGFLAGMVVSYLLNRRFTFSQSGRRAHREVRTFFIVSLGGLLLTVVIATGLRSGPVPWFAEVFVTGHLIAPVLADGEASAHALAIGLVAFYSFASHKFLTFDQGITAALRRLFSRPR